MGICILSHWILALLTLAFDFIELPTLSSYLGPRVLCFCFHGLPCKMNWFLSVSPWPGQEPDEGLPLLSQGWSVMWTPHMTYTNSH